MKITPTQTHFKHLEIEEGNVNCLNYGQNEKGMDKAILQKQDTHNTYNRHLQHFGLVQTFSVKKKLFVSRSKFNKKTLTQYFGKRVLVIK